MRVEQRPPLTAALATNQTNPQIVHWIHENDGRAGRSHSVHQRLNVSPQNDRINVVELYDRVESIDGGVAEVARRYDVLAEGVGEAVRDYREHEERLEEFIEDGREDTELVLRLQKEGEI